MNITYIKTHIQNMVTIHLAPTIYHHMDNCYRLRTLNAIIPKNFKKNWTYIHYPNCDEQVLAFIGCQLLIIQMTHSYTWHVFEFLCDGLCNSPIATSYCSFGGIHKPWNSKVVINNWCSIIYIECDLATSKYVFYEICVNLDKTHYHYCPMINGPIIIKFLIFFPFSHWMFFVDTCQFWTTFFWSKSSFNIGVHMLRSL
jgi:hypothetical protein